MNNISIQTQTLSATQTKAPGETVDGRELEQMVGVALIGDLNQQLADISNTMEHQLQEKQGLREEMEAIYSMKDKEIIDSNGTNYRELNLEEATLLKVRETAIPQIDPEGEVTHYLIEEDAFQEATKAGVKIREGKLSGLNSNGELTMLKIQSLIDQRKNALTLLSNLLAASNKVAQNIIGNIRN